MVQDVNELADTIREAFRIANTGRKGPVLIDITKDVTAAVTEFENKAKIEIVDDTVVDMEQLKVIANVINNAEKPVVMFGGGVVSSNASEEALQLAYQEYNNAKGEAKAVAEEATEEVVEETTEEEVTETIVEDTVEDTPEAVSDPAYRNSWYFLMHHAP